MLLFVGGIIQRNQWGEDIRNEPTSKCFGDAAFSEYQAEHKLLESKVISWFYLRFWSNLYAS